MAYNDLSEPQLHLGHDALRAEDEGHVPVFIPRETREAVLVLWDEAQSAYGEMLAEAGSSAFMLYGNSADAMSVAYQEVEPPRATPLIEECMVVSRLLRFEGSPSEYNPLRRVHFQRGGDYIPF